MMEQMAADHPAFDVIVIGAGPGGEDSATALLAAGLSVAMVESELIGGECFNYACVPSKAMLRPGHALRAAHRLPGAAEAVVGGLHAGSALGHRDDIVLHHDDSSEVERFTGLGATFVRGRGRLAGRRRVVVDTANGEHTLSATHAVIIATGSTPAIPDIPGLVAAGPWTNREATSAPKAPPALVVLGSGAVALEMAQAWISLGSEQVTVLSRRSSLLPDHEAFVGELVLEGLREAGVSVRFETRVTQVRRDGDRRVEIDLADGSRLHTDEILVATGKQPASTRIGLESVGVASGGFITVDDDMSVGEHDWLYAIGDVNGRALLTHQASYHARIAASAIIARSRGEQIDFRDEANDVAVPQVIFTDPEVATVGLTVAQARRRGIRARRVEADMGAVLGAQLHAHRYRGRASITIDDDHAVIVGATFVGQDVADMVHAATVAVAGRTPLRRLRHAIPSFPTMSEIWLDLLAGV
jgi:dihydrolipoamide dehydrogenase